jgi:alpha-L-fucosidase
VTNTPFKRDPIAELANECARRGDVKLGFYSSVLDWHHPAYRFRQQSGLAWSDYLEFLHGQVRELCTNFGELACLWFDGDWPRQTFDETNAYFAPGGSFEYDKLYDMIHTLQPNAVVMNNRHEKPLPGEDIQGFEQDLPGMNSAGFNTSAVYDLSLEVCMTFNDYWGYHTNDVNHKSARRLTHVLARSASGGANFLVNVGPTAEGEILPVHVERLHEVGQWLKVNGESIYKTRAGVIPPTAETVSTRRGDTHYLHVLEYISDCVTVSGVPETVSQARLLSNGAEIPLERRGERVTLTIPAESRDIMDTVIELF